LTTQKKNAVFSKKLLIFLEKYVIMRLVISHYFVGGKVLPNIKSAKKRVLITRARNGRNKARRSELKTALKKARADGASVQTIKATVGSIDRAATKGIIHRNKAARLKSRLAKKGGVSAEA
jgi:small subunit ribosomal protein S20